MIMREVYDYKDIRKLEETQIDGLIKNGMVITATSELSSAMASYYHDYTVMDIHGFIESIIPEWEETVNDIKNYIMLRNVIEDYVNDNKVSEQEYTYLRRNSKDIWNAIKLLIEADVYPGDINPGSSNPVKHFKKIWENLEEDNKGIQLFRLAFANELSEGRLVKKMVEDKAGNDIEDIFLIGFYFITPLQERVFDALENAGFRLVFLNCHDNKYEFATSIWEKTFADYYLKKTVENIQKDLTFNNHFGDALLGNNGNLSIEIVKHHTEFDFAEMVKKAVDRGETVYSSDVQKSENILREYYPEYYGQKHLLSYPVGQYVNYLHMMWDSFSNQMDLEFEYVFKCFASGWLSTEEVNARECLYDMKVLEPFFRGCHSKEEWERRLQQLIDARDSLRGFDERERGNERWHRLLGNPFNNVGVYTIDLRTLGNIKGLINKIIEDADFLFADNDRVDLYNHFQKIKRIIQAHIDKEELLDEEVAVTNELLHQLSDESTKGVVCPLSGVRDAIILLIGDYFSEYDSHDKETADKDRMVKPISMVEAAMLNNYGQKIHLVLANEFNLPGSPKKLPWPLTDSVLDSLRIQGKKQTQKYVRDMKDVIYNRPMSYRYLFFSFMGVSNNDNKPIISIEWICNDEKKEIDVSPYVKLMNVGSNYVDVIGKIGDYKSIINVSSATLREKNIPLPSVTSPEEVRMDYLVCRKRYIYSYLVNLLPRFVSEFHYSFELSKLISAFSTIAGIDKDVVANEMAFLFPFLRHIELRQSTDFASSQGTPDPYIFDGIEYPAQRLLTHYINDELIKWARKRDDDFMSGGEVTDNLAENSCTYCPYSDLCLDRHKKEALNYE